MEDNSKKNYLDNIISIMGLNKQEQAKSIIKQDNYIDNQNIEPNFNDVYNTKDWYLYEGYFENAHTLIPETLIELNNAAHDMCSHKLYHEVNKTVHKSNGVFLIYNASKKEYYCGTSNDSLKTLCKMFKSKHNILGQAYQRGDALRIKLVSASNDDPIFKTNNDIINDIIINTDAKIIRR